MCGRYVLQASQKTIAERFGATVSDAGLWSWEARYNITPTTVVPAVATDGSGARKLVPMRWGLHPHWRKEPPQGRPLFNARIETAAEKPSFRTPWRRRRALIPATHWYEWTGEQGGKIPWCIKPEGEPQDSEVFAFAGLWDHWRVDEGVSLVSCTILTMESDGPMQRLHDRMPVRLPEARWDAWLDPAVKAETLVDDALSAEDLIFWEVDRAVNSNRASGSDLITPAV
jgi:putative SOS response-associated peptidase YedK